jgi:hypothetical protein
LAKSMKHQWIFVDHQNSNRHESSTFSAQKHTD